MDTVTSPLDMARRLSRNGAGLFLTGLAASGMAWVMMTGAAGQIEALDSTFVVLKVFCAVCLIGGPACLVLSGLLYRRAGTTVLQDMYPRYFPKFATEPDARPLIAQYLEVGGRFLIRSAFVTALALYFDWAEDSSAFDWMGSAIHTAHVGLKWMSYLVIVMFWGVVAWCLVMAALYGVGVRVQGKVKS